MTDEMTGADKKLKHAKKQRNYARKRKETAVAEKERLLADNVRLQCKLDEMAHKHELEVVKLQCRIEMLQENRTSKPPQNTAKIDFMANFCVDYEVALENVGKLTRKNTLLEDELFAARQKIESLQRQLMANE